MGILASFSFLMKINLTEPCCLEGVTCYQPSGDVGVDESGNPLLYNSLGGITSETLITEIVRRGYKLSVTLHGNEMTVEIVKMG